MVFDSARHDRQAYVFGFAAAMTTQVVAAFESATRDALSFFPTLLTPALLMAMVYVAVRYWRHQADPETEIRRMVRSTALVTAFVSAAFHMLFGLWWFSRGYSILSVNSLRVTAPIALIGFVLVYLLVLLSGRLARGSHA